MTFRKAAWIMLPFLCLCCALTPATIATQTMLGYRGEYEYGSGPGEGVPPGSGNCDNAGVIYPDNPFSGWPVDYRPDDWSTITFYFCNIYPDGSPHWGIDLGVPEENPETRVLSTTERAIVRQVQPCQEQPNCWNYGMGRYVQIEAQVRVLRYDECVADHGGNPEADACWADSGWRATYMHLKETRVQEGQIVYRGDPLGLSGNTGNSTGPHLHYQINSPSDGAVDPAPTMR